MEEHNNDLGLRPEESGRAKALVVFVGNRIMLDDGIGPFAYDLLLESYDLPENVLV